jgi:hypothetical protein
MPSARAVLFVAGTIVAITALFIRMPKEHDTPTV